MAPAQQDTLAYVATLRTPPPPGSPYSVPVPNSASEGKSAIYRHWRFVDKPLLKTLDPAITTVHDAFETTVKQRPNQHALGTRRWDPVTKTHGNYEWMTYGQLAERRKNFGAGLVVLHKKAGVTDSHYGVGLWCQNRAEWQISGELDPFPMSVVFGPLG